MFARKALAAQRADRSSASPISTGSPARRPRDDVIRKVADWNRPRLRLKCSTHTCQHVAQLGLSAVPLDGPRSARRAVGFISFYFFAKIPPWSETVPELNSRVTGRRTNFSSVKFVIVLVSIPSFFPAPTYYGTHPPFRGPDAFDRFHWGVYW